MEDLPPPLEDATVLVDKIKTNLAQKKKLSEDVKKVKSDLLNLEISDEPKVPKLISDSMKVTSKSQKQTEKSEKKKSVGKVRR